LPKFASQIIISNNINFKSQLTSYGGMGYSNLYENIILPFFITKYSAEIINGITYKNMLPILAWWKEKPKQEIKQKTWKCHWCQKDYEESHDNFSKHGFIYCSIECLRAHSKTNFK